MAHTKPILAIGSTALGVALLLVAVNVQRDRFAFTSKNVGKPDALTNTTFALPMPEAMPRPAVRVEAIPTVVVEELQVLPANQPAQKRGTPRANESVKPAQPPCNPGWRELESGPAGRMVREVCQPPAPDAVPRS